MPINRVTQKTVYDQWHDYVPPETCMLLKIPVSLQSANPFNLQGPHALSNNEDSKRRSLGPIGLYMRGGLEAAVQHTGTIARFSGDRNG